MMPLSDVKLADIIDAFNTTSKYFDDILKVYDILFRQYEGRSFNCGTGALQDALKGLFIFHSFQQVGEFSLDRNSASSVKINPFSECR